MYNDAEYLAKCIDSVRAQTYKNWDCVIVNNCCSDGSAEIAQRFAAVESRIIVLDNEVFLPAEANHSHALRQISLASKYCKIVFSDDLLFPHCLEEMVAVAEAHPSVGIVGAYGLEGEERTVKWAGLPYPRTCFDGHEVCRRFFLDDIYVFGSPHSLLYRSDLVRGRDPFFNEADTHADTEVCFDILRNCDFGFVHQVLTYSSVQSESLREISRRLNTYVARDLSLLVKYGYEYLSPGEYDRCRKKIVDDYYNFLAVSLLKGGRDSGFWSLHKRKLAEAGSSISYSRLSLAVLLRGLRAVMNPSETFEKMKLTRARGY